MRNTLRVVLALALLAGLALPARTFERKLDSRDLRDAYFMGRDDTFRSERFLKDYVRTFPVPKEGAYISRIALSTPFKDMVDRARLAPDGYNPLKAEEDYKQQPPGLSVEITIELTASYPAHTPYTIPNFGPIDFRAPDFWKAFGIHLIQRGEVAPLVVTGHPTFSCPADGSCVLTGAVIRAVYNPAKVSSEPTRLVVVTPDGQLVEADFDLDQLR